jgi:hypothetical protein
MNQNLNKTTHWMRMDQIQVYYQFIKYTLDIFTQIISQMHYSIKRKTADSIRIFTTKIYFLLSQYKWVDLIYLYSTY